MATSAGGTTGPNCIMVGSAATASYGATAATPVDLLELDRRAVYTTPQTTDNSAGSLALNGKFSVTDTLQLQGNVYVRRFQQNHDDGNPADVERCSNSASPQYRNRLCLQDDGFPRPDPVTVAFRDQFAILDPANNPIPCPPGSGNTCNTTPYGTIDRTKTRCNDDRNFAASHATQTRCSDTRTGWWPAGASITAA